MFQLTEEAAQEVKSIIESSKSENKTYLKVALLYKGCSGAKYALTLENEYNEETDEKIEQHNIQVVYNKSQAEMLNDISLDFVDDGVVKGFKFSGGNTGSCSCSSGGCCS